jgi:hypothetical protein
MEKSKKILVMAGVMTSWLKKKIVPEICQRVAHLNDTKWKRISMSDTSKPLYHLSYRNSVGHTGRYGHEFLEFEFRPDGKMRYANNSHYKSEHMIRKEG